MTDLSKKECLRIDGCNNRERCGLFGACFLRLLQLKKWLARQNFTRACTGRASTCLYCTQEKSTKCISYLVINDIIDSYKIEKGKRLITYYISETEFFTTKVTSEWKLKILFRDKVCKECGTNSHLTIDHIIPLSKGGTDAISNLQALCFRCNNLKADKIYEL